MTRTQAKASKIVAAWAELAPTEVFGGYTLASFSQRVANAIGRTTTRAALREARSANIAQRVLADAASEAAMQSVIWSVLGHPDYGPASGLYSAMGYKPSRAPLDLLNYGREVGEGWTPEALLPRIWIDAARPGAISGGVVRDRSIFGNHFTAFGPAAVDSLGSLPAISLPPTAWLQNDSLIIDPAFTILMIGRHYTSTGIRHYFDSGFRGLPVRVFLRHNAVNREFQVITTGINEGDGQLEEILTPRGSAPLGVSPWIIALTSNANGSSFRLNGGQHIKTGALGAEGFRGLLIGRRSLTIENLWFDGSLGELLILQGVQSAETIARLEGYLAWKWLVAEILPAGHPWAGSKPQK